MSDLHPKPTPTDQVGQLAHTLARDGNVVDINGIVAHVQGLPTFTFTLAMGATFSLMALVWPFFGLAGVVFVIGSAVADMDAGNGWLRALLTKDLTQNVVVWTKGYTPEKAHEDKPTLIITSPIEDHIGLLNPQPTLLLAPLAGLLLSAVLVASQPWLGPQPSIVAATGLAVASIVAWSIGWAKGNAPKENASREVLIRSFEQAEAAQHIRVVWALVGGGTVHHDGLQTFLLNHRDCFAPSNTRVLILHPSRGPCAWIKTEGRIKTTLGDPVLGALADHMKIPHRDDITGARKAHHLGWRATGLCVASDQVHIGTRVVCGIIAGADRLAQDGEW